MKSTFANLTTAIAKSDGSLCMLKAPKSFKSKGKDKLCPVVLTGCGELV